MAIRVACNYRDRLAHLRFCQGETAGSCATDINSSSLPLVADRSESIRIAESVRCCQGHALRCRTGDRHAARRQIIHVRHCRGCRTAHTFMCSVGVCVASNCRDRLANLRFCQGETAGSCATDINSSSLPLVNDCAKSVRIAESVRCQEGHTLGCRTGERHASCRQIIHVRHCRGYRTAYMFNRSVTVGIAGNNLDCLAHLRVRQSEAASGGSANVAPYCTVGR